MAREKFLKVDKTDKRMCIIMDDEIETRFENSRIELNEPLSNLIRNLGNIFYGLGIPESTKISITNFNTEIDPVYRCYNSFSIDCYDGDEFLFRLIRPLNWKLNHLFSIQSDNFTDTYYMKDVYSSSDLIQKFTQRRLKNGMIYCKSYSDDFYRVAFSVTHNYFDSSWSELKCYMGTANYREDELKKVINDEQKLEEILTNLTIPFSVSDIYERICDIISLDNSSYLRIDVNNSGKRNYISWQNGIIEGTDIDTIGISKVSRNAKR